MTTYKINTDIPGWSSEEKLNMLARYASDVKDSGWIVEIGCYVGRSTYALGMNKKDSVTLTCIDPWPKQQFGGRPYKDDILGYPRNSGEEYNFETWQMYTRNIKNIDPMRMWAPLSHDSVIKPSKKADLVFIDGGHTEEETYENIVYWNEILAKGGTIIIDDYQNNLHPWPGVDRACDRAARELQLDKSVIYDCMVLVK